MHTFRPLKVNLLRLLSQSAVVRTEAQIEGCGADVCRGKFGPKPVMQTTLGNGMGVATANRASHLAAIAVNFLAGSRYEVDRQLGATHFLRNMAGASGRYTQYMKVRHLQQMGAQLTCTSDRQSITYTMLCPPWWFKDAQNYLLDAASCCDYSRWESDERLPTVEEDLVRITPHQGLMDLIQTAAFKGGLANSVFCKKHQINEIDSDTLNGFVEDNFLNERCSIASVGLVYEDTIKFAERIILPKILCSPKKRSEESPKSGANPLKASFRPGYEVYDLGPCPVTWMAVAIPGCGASNFRCLLAYWVLATSCGTRNSVGHRRFLRSVQPPLGRLTVDDTTDHWAFNVAYNDVGIFGIAARTASYQARDVGHRILNFLNQGLVSITAEQIKIGKRRLIMDLMASEESCVSQATSLAHMLATRAEIPGSWIDLVESVDDNDVIKVAKHLATITGIRVALVQLAVGADKVKNIAHAVKEIHRAKKLGAQLVALPECFNSPYGTKYFDEYAEEIPSGATSEALSRAAAETGLCVVGGTIPERHAGRLFNTCTVWSSEGRLIAKHRKVHLFDIDIPGKMTFKESEVLSPGQNLTTFDFKGVKIGLGICYDLRFQEMAQIYAAEGCSVLLYPGAFNLTTGPLHWELLGRARATDQQLWVGLVSPARDADASYVAWGHSTLVDPWGKVVAKLDENPDILVADIDLNTVDEVRSQIPIRHQRRTDLYDTLVKTSTKW